MLNKILLIAALLISTAATSQKTEVVDSLTDSKAKLFSKSLIWVASTWKSANNVIQMKDESEGIIVVKGGLSAKPKTLGVPGDGITMVTITIRVKDGKAKIEFEGSNFKYTGGSSISQDGTGRTHDKWLEAVISEEELLISSFRSALIKKDDF